MLSLFCHDSDEPQLGQPLVALCRLWRYPHLALLGRMIVYHTPLALLKFFEKSNNLKQLLVEQVFKDIPRLLSIDFQNQCNKVRGIKWHVSICHSEWPWDFTNVFYNMTRSHKYFRFLNFLRNHATFQTTEICLFCIVIQLKF